jgi:hypothetical protein
MRNKFTRQQKIQKKEEWQQRLIKKGNKFQEQGNKLCPRCIYEDQEITLSSEGYFTPCCWLDDELYRNQPYVNTFFKPHLNIELHDNIQDIFDSQEWKDFWDLLLNRPEDAPPVCYEYCATYKGNKEVLEEDYKNSVSVIRKH